MRSRPRTTSQARPVFACVDALLLTDHVLPHTHVGGFWAPGALARALQVPAPTTPLAVAALAVLVLGTAGRTGPSSPGPCCTDGA